MNGCPPPEWYEVPMRDLAPWWVWLMGGVIVAGSVAAWVWLQWWRTRVPPPVKPHVYDIDGRS